MNFESKATREWHEGTRQQNQIFSKQCWHNSLFGFMKSSTEEGDDLPTRSQVGLSPTKSALVQPSQPKSKLKSTKSIVATEANLRLDFHPNVNKVAVK